MTKLFRIIISIISTIFLFSCVGTGVAMDLPSPQLNQIQAIAELAVLDSYYHNVAKFSQSDVEGFWLWSKDKEFWIEYSGIVTVGIDFSRVSMTLNGSEVIIALPEAEVQSVSVDSSSLSEDSFIVDKDSAQINAEDERIAFEEAQKQLEANASNDTALLVEAKDRVKSLLENYIENIAKVADTEYTIKWQEVTASE